MKEVGDVEFVQICGVLGQKEHMQQSEPSRVPGYGHVAATGSKGQVSGMRVLGPGGKRTVAAQNPGVKQGTREPGRGLCPRQDHEQG